LSWEVLLSTSPYSVGISLPVKRRTFLGNPAISGLRSGHLLVLSTSHESQSDGSTVPTVRLALVVGLVLSTGFGGSEY